MAEDTKKPYGEVRYADPGYQKDGKARYPISTAAHVRSAWSYINQAGNAAKYDPKEREAVKARIRSAAKRLGVDIAEKAYEVAVERGEPTAAELVLADQPLVESGGNLQKYVTGAAGTMTYNTEPAAYSGNGCMVALFLPVEVAGKLAVDGGEPAEDLHVTLAYLPEAPIGEDHERMLKVLAGMAETQGPLTGEISGVGVFNLDPAKNDGMGHVTYASVDLPALPEFRQRLVDTLNAGGFVVAANHGYTPHCSLKYTEDATLFPVPTTPLRFNQLSYAAGPAREHYDFVERETAAVKVRCAECGEEYFVDSEEEISEHKKKHAPKEKASVIVTERVVETAYAEMPAVRAFLAEVNGKMILTAPATAVPRVFEKALTPNPYYLWIDGALVGAEKANRNGAFWSTSDLEFGEHSVPHGPVNWLHQDRRVIGAIAAHKLVKPSTEQAAEGAHPYIQTASVIWRWLFPDEATVIEQASDQQRLWLSMECISRVVACTGENGCGQEFDYFDTMDPNKVCQHVREKSSIRHFKDPTFLGTAIILPPVRPGWAEAHATVMREAAALAPDAYEQAGSPDIPAGEWEQIMACVVDYANSA